MREATAEALFMGTTILKHVVKLRPALHNRVADRGRQHHNDDFHNVVCVVDTLLVGLVGIFSTDSERPNAHTHQYTSERPHEIDGL